MTLDYPPYYGGRGYYPWPWYDAFLAQRSLRLVTPATSEPITLDQARRHLRLDTYGSPEGHEDDALLEQIYIPAARALCESISGRAFVPQEYELALGAFPTQYVAFGRNGVKLGIGPVRGVTYVIYNDGTSVVTVDPSVYTLDQFTDGGYIYSAYGTSWPTPATVPGAVRVGFSAGYDIEGASPTYEFVLPAHYRWAMLLALGHIYENREDTTTLNLANIPLGVQAMLGPDSLVNGFA